MTRESWKWSHLSNQSSARRRSYVGFMRALSGQRRIQSSETNCLWAVEKSLEIFGTVTVWKYCLKAQSCQGSAGCLGVLVKSINSVLVEGRGRINWYVLETVKRMESNKRYTNELTMPTRNKFLGQVSQVDGQVKLHF